MPKVAPHKSETLWVNALIIISAVGTALLADDTFKAVIGDSIGLIGAFIGLVGIVLRISTSKPLGYDYDNVLEQELRQADDNYLKDF